MRIDVCSVCGEYHNYDECSAADRVSRKTKQENIIGYGKEEKFKNHERPNDKRKSFKRPPVDKMYRGSIEK